MKEGVVKRFPFIVGFLMTTVVFLSVAAAADEGFNAVKPRNFDPFHTRLVNASWVAGIGCPTNAKVVLFNSVSPYQLLPPSTYTDPACTTGDSRDKNNEGLLMAKTGPTPNDAAAVADLVGVKGTVLTELGYDRVDVLGISWGGGVAQHFAAFQRASATASGCCRRATIWDASWWASSNSFSSSFLFTATSRQSAARSAAVRTARAASHRSGDRVSG